MAIQLNPAEARYILLQRSAALGQRILASYELGQSAMTNELRAVATALNQLANQVAAADPTSFPG